MSLSDDKTAVPKVHDPNDQCGWSCWMCRPERVGKKKETKTVSTVGEFVRFCIEPSLE